MRVQLIYSCCLLLDNGRLDILIIGCPTSSISDEDQLKSAEFVALFEVTHGFNHDESVAFEQLVQPLLLSPGRQDYSLTKAPGCNVPIDFTLSVPLVVELLGSGFVREHGCDHFVVRFPRIKRLRPDLSVPDAITFDELQQIAHESVFDVNTDADKVSYYTAKLASVENDRKYQTSHSRPSNRVHVGTEIGGYFFVTEAARPTILPQVHKLGEAGYHRLHNLFTLIDSAGSATRLIICDPREVEIYMRKLDFMRHDRRNNLYIIAANRDIVQSMRSLTT